MAGSWIAFAAVCLVFQFSTAVSVPWNENEKDLKMIMDILRKGREPERYSPLRFVNNKYGGGSNPTILSMSWKNCGKPTDPLQLKNLTLSPDPIELPGNVGISAGVTLKTPVGEPIKVSLTIKKKVIVWIEVPCVDNVGSCTYEDVCSMIPIKPGQPCPAPLGKYGIPCRCPFKSGKYYLPGYSFYLNPGSSIPSFLETGDYTVQAKLSSKGKDVGCIYVELSLKKN